MSTVPSSATDRVALYMRVSSEGQSERGTIEAQREFLASYAKLYGLSVAGEYADEGWSGTLPLEDRPEGRRLLDDARSGLFHTVIVYRLDRLGRSLTALIAAHDALETVGVAIKSASEPFDTQQPIGKFLFQLLGSLAELDRSNVVERLRLGRDRVARAGKWTSGPVPFGYDLDEAGCLTPSERIVQSTGQTEAETLAGIFKRVAEGATILDECRRMDSLGVSVEQRYAGGTSRVAAQSWRPSRLHFILKNPGYHGSHVLKSKNGPIERDVPALADRATWDAAQAGLARNQRLSVRNSKTKYLLRGLITCTLCGRRYVGTSAKQRSGKVKVEYRCAGQLTSASVQAVERCRARILPSDLETTVWADCRRFIDDPGEMLQEAQTELRKRMGDVVNVDEQRRRLTRLLAEKEAERERVMTLFRRGRATLEDVEQQLDAVQK